MFSNINNGNILSRDHLFALFGRNAPDANSRGSAYFPDAVVTLSARGHRGYRTGEKERVRLQTERAMSEVLLVKLLSHFFEYRYNTVSFLNLNGNKKWL